MNDKLLNKTQSYSTFSGQSCSSKIHQRRRSLSSSSSIETLNEANQNEIQSTSKTHNISSPFTLYIENHASVARDHMANERTYLAWVRTSLSTISIGVALTQLFRFDKSLLKNPEAAEELYAVGKPLGVAFIVIGMFYLIFACIRYFHSQEALTKGYFPASRGIVILASASIFVALVSVFITISQKH